MGVFWPPKSPLGLISSREVRQREGCGGVVGSVGGDLSPVRTRQDPSPERLRHLTRAILVKSASVLLFTREINDYFFFFFLSFECRYTFSHIGSRKTKKKNHKTKKYRTKKNTSKRHTAKTFDSQKV